MSQSFDNNATIMPRRRGATSTDNDGAAAAATVAAASEEEALPPTIDMTTIERLVQGQQQRNIAASTRSSYLAQVKCFIEKILILPDQLKETAFECNDAGSYKYHTGEASHLIKLKLPISVAVVVSAFALIAIDPTMARQKKRTAAQRLVDEAEDPTGKYFVVDRASEYSISHVVLIFISNNNSYSSR